MFKKCKAKFCKSLQEALYLLLGDRTKIQKLPQHFVININIKYNKKYIDSTLEEIYRDFNILNSIEYFKTLNSHNYQQILQLLKITFSEGYQSFLMSDLFNQYLERICSKKGVEMTLLFYYASHIFLDYIKTSKGIVEKENKKCEYLIKHQQTVIKSPLMNKEKKLFSVQCEL